MLDATTRQPNWIFKIVLFSFVWFVACLSCLDYSIAQEVVAEPGTRFLIRGVNIIDVESGQTIANQDILIEGSTIAKIADSPLSLNDDSVEIVDAEGKFAIPGLWDMHIHTLELASMQLFPLNGVTGVRIMWGMPTQRGWESAFEERRHLGPRMIFASAIMDGPEPVWPGSLVVRDEVTAKKAVDLAIAANADFLKVYSLLPRDAYFEIARQAKIHGIPFAGHVPLTVDIREASNAGQQTMEHLYEIMIACSREETELREMQSAVIESSGRVRALYEDKEMRKAVSRRILDSFDKKKAAELFALLKKNESWQCPTLTVLHNLANINDRKLREDPRLDYLTPFFRSTVAPKNDPRNRTEEELKFAQLMFSRQLELVGEMHRAGVPLLAGTDCLNPFCLPGFSLHDELKLMVKSGLTPLDAIRTATINPARLFNETNVAGSVAPGKRADLVLLNADPLENIENTTKIFAVVNNGQLLSEKELKRRLDELKEKQSAALKQ